MKMTKEHYTQLQDAINGIRWTRDTPDMQTMLVQYLDADLTTARFRWDVMYLSGLKPGLSANGSKWPVYDYLDDSHIDTALRKITKHHL